MKVCGNEDAEFVVANEIFLNNGILKVNLYFLYSFLFKSIYFLNSTRNLYDKNKIIF